MGTGIETAKVVWDVLSGMFGIFGNKSKQTERPRAYNEHLTALMRVVADNGRQLRKGEMPLDSTTLMTLWPLEVEKRITDMQLMKQFSKKKLFKEIREYDAAARAFHDVFNMFVGEVWPRCQEFIKRHKKKDTYDDDPDDLVNLHPRDAAMAIAGFKLRPIEYATDGERARDGLPTIKKSGVLNLIKAQETKSLREKLAEIEKLTKKLFETLKHAREIHAKKYDIAPDYVYTAW